MRNNKITKTRKYNIYGTMVKSSLLYGSDIWRITDRYKSKVQAVFKKMKSTRRKLDLKITKPKI